MPPRKAERQPPPEEDQPEPWEALNWSSHGPYGAAKLLAKPLPCVICDRPSWLLSPRRGEPTHLHPCATEFVMVGYLAPILRALGM